MDSSNYPGGRSPALSKYLSEIRSYPLLSKEQEISLAENARKAAEENRDPDREQSLRGLVESNLSFVVKVASEYKNLGIPFEDLLNEGNVGLIEAAHRYDPTKGTKFITYAIWWIRKSILKALSEQSSLVRVPNYQMKRINEVRQAERSLRRTLGRKPNRDEISAQMDSTISKIDELLQYGLKSVSIDENVKDRDVPMSDYLVDDSNESAEQGLLRTENRKLVKQALQVLTEQEATVIVNRFGLNGTGRGLTLKEIGLKMGISRERVRQVEAQAKKRIRSFIAKQKYPRLRSATSPSRRPRRNASGTARKSLAVGGSKA